MRRRKRSTPLKTGTPHLLRKYLPFTRPFFRNQFLSDAYMQPSPPRRRKFESSRLNTKPEHKRATPNPRQTKFDAFPLKDQRHSRWISARLARTVKQRAPNGDSGWGCDCFGTSDERNVKENVRDDLCVHRPLMTLQLPASFSLSSKTLKKKKEAFPPVSNSHFPPHCIYVLKKR